MNRIWGILLCLTLLPGCRTESILTFWNTHSIDYSDVSAAQDQFAEFAEKAVASDEAEAIASLDVLFDKLKEDEVAYYLYSNWFDGAFYNPLSPCRNAALYSKAADRIVSDGILTASDAARFIQNKEWIMLNRVGSKAVIPGVPDINTRTLVVVLDPGCPSCRNALASLASDPQLGQLRRVAVCCGFGADGSSPKK